MAITHLSRSRHKTQYYFRRRVPGDLRDCFEHATVIESLGTSDRRTAIIRARVLAAFTDALFHRLRTMPPLDRSRFLALTIKAKLSDVGVVQELSIEAEPHETEAAARLTEVLLTTQAAQRSVRPSAGRLPGLPTPAGKSITETFAEYKAEKIKGGNWKDGEDTAKYDHWPHVRALVQLIGDKPINMVTADEIEEFQSEVLTAPDGGSPRNRKKRIERAGAVFRWAKSKRRIADDFHELFRFSGRLEESPYLKFDISDLKALFESDEYRNAEFGTPSEYWLPVLALYTGARLNELCQLQADDISMHDEIHTISILDGDFKRLKTRSSQRIIPIHSKLIEIGFLDYVSSIRSGRIFPELPENPARPGDFAKEPSRKFTAYRRKCGVGSDITDRITDSRVGRSNKTFHSFRSTLISTMRLLDVPKDRRTRLAGHEYDDTQDRNYTGGDVLTMFSFKTLKADIESVSFDIQFHPYKRSVARIRRPRV